MYKKAFSYFTRNTIIYKNKVQIKQVNKLYIKIT